MKKLIVVLIIIGVYLMAKAANIINRMAVAMEDWEDGVRDKVLTPGTISGNNNNPGNLKPVGFTYAGQIGIDRFGHAIFDTYAHGWNALINQLKMAINGTSNVYSPTDTLYDFFGKYAEANSVPYAEFVASQIGVSPTTQLKNLVV